jgi:superfamily II DNA/RNA helicase
LPRLALGKDVLVAAETGSGKTMAYIAPLVSRLREEEAALVAASVANADELEDVLEVGAEGGSEGGDGSPAAASTDLQQIQRPNRPRALVLVPTRELVRQVIAASKTLCHDAPFRAVGLHHSMKRCATDLAGGADIVVGVPSRVDLLRKKGRCIASPCPIRTTFLLSHLLGCSIGAAYSTRVD